MRRAAAGAALALAGLFWAAPALGDATITAGPVPNQFSTPDVTIDQGQNVTFQNSDRTAIHDLSAEDLHRYVLSDARLARQMVERRIATALAAVDVLP